MQIWKVVLRALEEFNNIRTEGKALYWFIVVINILFAIFVLYTNVLFAKKGLWKSINFIGKVFYVILVAVRFLLLPIISVFFVFAGEMEIATSDLFNNRYFIEIIIIAIVGFILKVMIVQLHWKITGDDDVDDETAEEIGKSLVINLFLLIFSVLFLITNLENGLVNFGFSIFGKKLGAWIFGAYAAWSGATVISALSDFVNALTCLTSLAYVKKSK